MPNQTIKYDGHIVGTISHDERGVVFEWNQEKFRYFSTDSTAAYGMGRGLQEKLDGYDVDVVEVEAGEFSFGDITTSRLVPTDHEVFHDGVEEPQWLIKVDRDGPEESAMEW